MANKPDKWWCLLGWLKALWHFLTTDPTKDETVEEQQDRQLW